MNLEMGQRVLTGQSHCHHVKCLWRHKGMRGGTSVRNQKVWSTLKKDVTVPILRLSKKFPCGWAYCCCTSPPEWAPEMNSMGWLCENLKYPVIEHTVAYIPTLSGPQKWIVWVGYTRVSVISAQLLIVPWRMWPCFWNFTDFQQRFILNFLAKTAVRMIYATICQSSPCDRAISFTKYF